LSLLEQTPSSSKKILLDAPDSTLSWKPASDRWSISEVLAHLADVEQANRDRTRRMAQEDSPKLESYDQNAIYASGKYSGGSGRERLHTSATNAIARFPCSATFRMARWGGPASTLPLAHHAERLAA